MTASFASSESSLFSTCAEFSRRYSFVSVSIASVTFAGRSSCGERSSLYTSACRLRNSCDPGSVSNRVCTQVDARSAITRPCLVSAGMEVTLWDWTLLAVTSCTAWARRRPSSASSRCTRLFIQNHSLVSVASPNSWMLEKWLSYMFCSSCVFASGLPISSWLMNVSMVSCANAP